LRIALAQLNAVVGDLEGNRERILDFLGRAREADADLVVFPELAVTGYPPEDLLLRPGFVRAARDAIAAIAAETKGIVALVGTPWFDRDLANACAVCADGEIRAVYRKQFLPNYGVFDEHRYFAEGRDLVLLRFGEAYAGITICEDVWQPGPPAADLALAGAQLLVNLSASPYHVGKAEEREEMLVTRARDTASFFAFCNLVGGQDELVFDGHSVVLDDAGEVLARAPGFEEHLLVCDVAPELAMGRRLRDVRRRELDRSRESLPAVELVELPAAAERTAPAETRTLPFAPELEQMRLALTLGLRDYVEKNGFRELITPGWSPVQSSAGPGAAARRRTSEISRSSRSWPAQAGQPVTWLSIAMSSETGSSRS
jgi:NAD+ synthase (glutamine-hydrolysing)